MLAKRGEVLTSCQQLVDIGLVPGVEHHAVPRGGFEIPVDSEREFNNAQVGTKVSTRCSYVGDQEFPDFAGQLFQLRAGQFGQVPWILDGFQKSQRPSLG